MQKIKKTAFKELSFFMLWKISREYALKIGRKKKSDIRNSMPSLRRDWRAIHKQAIVLC